MEYEFGVSLDMDVSRPAQASCGWDGSAHDAMETGGT